MEKKDEEIEETRPDRVLVGSQIEAAESNRVLCLADEVAGPARAELPSSYILVVEDDSGVGRYLKTLIAEVSKVTVLVVTTIRGAHEELGAHRVPRAIVDLVVANGKTHALIDMLLESKVTTLAFSGNPDEMAKLADHPLLTKIGKPDYNGLRDWIVRTAPAEVDR